MTKLVLTSAENVAKAKLEIKPLAISFLKAEPGNTMGIPRTRDGGGIVTRIYDKLKQIGYSSDDAQFMFSELIEQLDRDGDTGSSAATPVAPKRPRDDNF